jgi:hypothetical protein
MRELYTFTTGVENGVEDEGLKRKRKKRISIITNQVRRKRRRNKKKRKRKRRYKERKEGRRKGGKERNK